MRCSAARRRGDCATATPNSTRLQSASRRRHDHVRPAPPAHRELRLRAGRRRRHRAPQARPQQLRRRQPAHLVHRTGRALARLLPLPMTRGQASRRATGATGRLSLPRRAATARVRASQRPAGDRADRTPRRRALAALARALGRCPLTVARGRRAALRRTAHARVTRSGPVR